MGLGRAELNRNLSYWALGTATIILIAYVRVSQFQFVWDDAALLSKGGFYEGKDLLSAIWANFPISENYFRPLVVSTFVMDALVFNNNPGAMHLHNLFFHVASTLLVGGLTAQILYRWNSLNSGFFPALAALLFGLHPMLVESVAWVSGRFDVYVTFWILLLINMDLLLPKLHWRIVSAYMLFIMAALSKEMAAPFPLVYLLIRMMLLKEQGSLYVRFKALYEDGSLKVFSALVAAACTYLALRFSALGYLQEEFDKEIVAAHFGTALQHLLLVGKTAGTYLLYSVAGGAYTSPAHYQTFPISYGDLGAWVGLVAFLAIIVASVIMVLKGIRAGYLFLVFFAALAPVLNIVFWPNVEDMVQERFLSLPLALMIALLVALLVEHFARDNGFEQKKRILILALVSLMMVNAVITVACIPIWKNHMSLWTWAVHRAPLSPYANANLSVAYHMAEDLVNARKYAEIANQLDIGGVGAAALTAVGIAEKQREVSAALDAKQYELAISIADQEMKQESGLLDVELNIFLFSKAKALHALGRNVEAINIMEALLAKKMDNQNYAFFLGAMLNEQGDVRRANACWILGFKGMSDADARKISGDGKLHLELLVDAAKGASCLK